MIAEVVATSPDIQPMIHNIRRWARGLQRHQRPSYRRVVLGSYRVCPGVHVPFGDGGHRRFASAADAESCRRSATMHSVTRMNDRLVSVRK